MPTHPLSLPEQKRLLRQAMRERRTALVVDDGLAQAAALHDIFLHHLAIPSGAMIATYQPFRHEMSPSLLNEALRARGHRLCLPVVTQRDMPLIFRLFDATTRLIPHAMGIAEPAEDAPVCEPDWLLVPLLAFDRQHNRLGYGGGFYDRTLTALRARKNIVATGIAFDGQHVDLVPTNPYDAQLDHIVTELNVY